MRQWLRSHAELVKRVKMMVVFGTVAEMVGGIFSGFFDPDSAGTIHAITVELGAIYSLYIDPDDWKI